MVPSALNGAGHSAIAPGERTVRMFPAEVNAPGRAEPWLTPARVGLAICGVGLQLWASMAVLRAPGADLSRHVALTLGSWAIWLAAIWLVLGLPARHRRLDLALIFALAALIRLTLLFSPPSLSDDVYRAVWDARLIHAGVNPYVYAPAAPELALLRDDAVWPRVNHKEQRTPYAPLAELLAAVAYAIAPERLAAMQALFALLDFATAVVLAWLLGRIGLDPRRALVVAWSPIGALHFAHSGHNDSAMLLALVVGAGLIAAGKPWLAQMALGLATMVKWVPVLLVPAFARATGWRAVLGWATVCALLALPLAGAGSAALAGVLEESSGQRFNESSYLVVERIVGAVAPALAFLALRLFPLIVVAGVVALSWQWGEPTARGALVGSSRVLAAYLLVAPVVEPWYFTWLAPLIALTICRGAGPPFAANDAPAWLWLSGMATLTDLTYPAGGAALWPLIRTVEYLPAYALLAVATLRWVRTRRAGVLQTSVG